MGRRSNFPRVAKDHYPTVDPRAVVPLIPHLTAGLKYAEPMAGEGHLIDLLAPHIELAWASTIDPCARPDIHENDVLNVGRGEADIFITNPVWSRPLLHKLIVHLSDLAPTFLLFDSAWANTRQAKPYLARCRRIIAVGRLIWMEGTKTSGKDDCSWYLFDKPSAVPTEFYGRGILPPSVGRAGRVCFDCKLVIGRSEKWKLAERGGVATCVHRQCENPTSYFPRSLMPIAPTPLFDVLPGARLKLTMAPGDEPEDACDLVIPAFLRRVGAS